MKILCNALTVAPALTLYHTGPALDHGPLSSLFYFALSGPDSLTLDPFNQLVQFLRGHMIRVFSLTLPGHENGLSPTGAMAIWAEELSRSLNYMENFLEQAQQAIDFAVRERFVLPEKMAIAGLSRGGFIAAHLAARDPRFRFLLGLAPLTRLSRIKEFSHLQNHPLIDSLDLIHLSPALADRHIRLSIGNRDTRVGTRECFAFAMAIAEQKEGKTAQIELMITPSIGQMGHGTSPEIFQQGANWLAKGLVN